MLHTLRIKNFALVTDLTLELRPGFNAITGETGAGKSILIGALALLLGERADRTLIRSGADTCSVEATFQLEPLADRMAQFLAESGLEPCDDGQLFLKRTLSTQGQHRQFINGSPATRQALETLGEWLVDIHGPYDHQSLLHPPSQLLLLDSFAGLLTVREAHARQFAEREPLRQQLAEVSGGDLSTAERADLLRHQIAEIAAAAIDPQTEAAFAAAYSRAANSARLLEIAQQALQQLDDDESALLPVSRQVGKLLAELVRIDPGMAELRDLHEQAATVLTALRSQLSAYAERIDLDAAQLAELEGRMTRLQDLKRKFGRSLEEIRELEPVLRQELAGLEQRGVQAVEFAARLKKLDDALQTSARKLSAARKKAAPNFCADVKKQLREVGFTHAGFAIQFADQPAEARAPGASGWDQIELQFSPNAGEPVRPLRAIASSGELARVMLALKNSFAALHDVPVLIFDEVDANVGGETARAVGEKMRRLGKGRQVLCITHLPIVAAQADVHYCVSKRIRDGRTVTEVDRLEDRARAVELARMLGGQTEAALRHAEAMLKG